MGRFRNTARSLATGYAAMGTNIVYTLASVPLALHYLPKKEFGLWALVLQMGNYLTLIDLGMSGAAARILIDHKDKKNDGVYGAVIKTGSIVLALQGVCLSIGGLVLSFFLPAVMEVPAEYARVFQLLVIGNCLIIGLSFPGRILMNILQAHQRFDVINYSQIGQLAIGFGVQWITFHRGWGLYSLLAAGAANYLFGVAHNLVWVSRARLFPDAHEWGRASMSIFKELWDFGKELFLLSVGLQLLNASQVVIISRMLGLEAAALWSIGTRTLQLAFQFVQRIFDFSAGALSEMIVREEKATLRRRFGDVLGLTASLAVLTGTGVALCNSAFVTLWTKAELEWPWRYDMLLGLLLLLTLVTRCFVGLTGVAKQIGKMQWIYFFEGLSFVVLGCLLVRIWGMAGLLVSAIVVNLLWSGAYGLRWVSRYLGVGVREIVFLWLKPAALYLTVLGPLAVVLGYATSNMSAVYRFGINAATIGLAGLVLLWGVGVRSDVREDFKQRVARFRLGRKSEPNPRSAGL